MMHQARVAVFVHVTWGAWDRLPLLVGDAEARVYRAIGAECAALGVQLVALGGVEDHVHLLIRQPATIGLAELMKRIKGVSAHLATHEVSPGEFFKWQGGYAAFSVSPRHLRQVSDYIANQGQYHLSGTLLPMLEPEAEDFPTPPPQSA
jgi:REP element-mobilizing transposase RayT